VLSKYIKPYDHQKVHRSIFKVLRVGTIRTYRFLKTICEDVPKTSVEIVIFEMLQQMQPKYIAANNQRKNTELFMATAI